jgi:hypothetical protein
MDETERGEAAETVLERLRRVRELDRAGAPAPALLDELRELVAEAEAWARLEGDERAGAAAAALAEHLSGIEEVCLETATIH